MIDVGVDQVLDRAVDRSRVLVHARLQLREVGFHTDSSPVRRSPWPRPPRADPSLSGGESTGFLAAVTNSVTIVVSRIRKPLRARSALHPRALDGDARTPERAGRARLALVPPGECHPVARRRLANRDESRTPTRGGRACAPAGRPRRPVPPLRLGDRGEDDRPAARGSRPHREAGARLDARRRSGDASAGGGEDRRSTAPRPVTAIATAAPATAIDSEAADPEPERPALGRQRPEPRATGKPQPAFEAVLLARRRGAPQRGQVAPRRSRASWPRRLASSASSARPQLGQKRAPIRIGRAAGADRRVVAGGAGARRARRSRETRASIATSSAQRSTTRPR